MVKMPRPIRRSGGKKNIGRGVRRHRVRKYKLPKRERFFLLDAEIGKFLMKELAEKTILVTLGVMSVEELRAHSKKEIMARFKMSEKRFDARAMRIRPLIEAHLQRKMVDVLLSMGRDTREKLEAGGKLGRRRKQ